MATPPVTGSTPETEPQDIELAIRAIRIHCLMYTPTGDSCRNCGWPFPCITHRWGSALLVSAGYHQADIDGLDQRTGPWS